MTVYEPENTWRTPSTVTKLRSRGDNSKITFRRSPAMRAIRWKPRKDKRGAPSNEGGVRYSSATSSPLRPPEYPPRRLAREHAERTRTRPRGAKGAFTMSSFTASPPDIAATVARVLAGRAPAQGCAATGMRKLMAMRFQAFISAMAKLRSAISASLKCALSA